MFEKTLYKIELKCVLFIVTFFSSLMLLNFAQTTNFSESTYNFELVMRLKTYFVLLTIINDQLHQYLLIF